MNEIYTIGDYHVHTWKMDHCPIVENQDVVDQLIFVGLLISVPAIALIWAILYSIDKHSGNIFLMVAGICVCICVAIMVLFRTTDKCGLMITLDHYKRDTIHVKYYRFSGDIERDAVKIKAIVDKLSKKADALYADDIKEQTRHTMKQAQEIEHAARCCTLYKEVLDKVKE